MQCVTLAKFSNHTWIEKIVRIYYEYNVNNMISADYQSYFVIIWLMYKCSKMNYSTIYYVSACVVCYTLHVLHSPLEYFLYCTKGWRSFASGDRLDWKECLPHLAGAVSKIWRIMCTPSFILQARTSKYSKQNHKHRFYPKVI